MRSHLQKFTLLAACVCAFRLTAGAAELKRADVMADPAWLLHLDCDALRTNTIGQYVLSQMDKPEAKAKLASFQTIFGFDLRNQVHGVTLYGSSLRPNDGVLIVYVDFDTDHLIALAQAAYEYQSSPHNQHTTYSWIDTSMKRKGVSGHRVYAAFEGKRVILGQREDRVTEALEVIDGTSPSLDGDSTFPGLGLPGNGHFIEAAVRKMDSTNLAPSAAIMRLSKSVQVVAGEQDNQFQGTLTLAANSDDAANQIFSIAQGLVTVMKLQSNNQDVGKLANAVTLTQNGSEILGKLTLPADDVVAMMQSAAQRMAAARAAGHVSAHEAAPF
jgi:hypothetical protein